MRRLALIMSLLLFAGLNAMFAQTTTITGTVTDSESGEPIPGVSVVVRGTTIGTITRVDGTYSLSVPEDATNLLYSFVGMKTQDVVMSGRKKIDIQMSSDVMGIDEVIVSGVAAGTPRKKLSVSVGKVSEDALKEVPATSAASALQGKMSGVTVVQSTGNPGDGATILVRGATQLSGSQDPLIIVDGVMMNGTLADVNVDDIESIEVVKGASASALYGSRAGNGVVVVTTKRGKGMAAGSTSVTFRNEFGVNKLGNKYDLAKSHGYQLASDWEDYSTFTKYAGVTYPEDYDGGPATGIDGSRVLEEDHYMDNPYARYTDAQEEFFEGNSFYTNYLSVAHSSGKTNFLSSFENTHQGGLLPNTDGYDRQSIRFNIDHRLSDKLKFSASNSFIKSETQYPGGESKYNGGVFFALLLTAPDVDLYRDNPDGQPYMFLPDHWEKTTENPLYNLWKKEDMLTRDRFLGSYSLNWDITSGLKFEAKYGFENTVVMNTSYNPYDTYERGSGDFGFQYSEGQYYKYTSKLFAETAQATLNYSKHFGFWNTRAKLSYLYENTEFESYSATGNDFGVAGIPSFDAIKGNQTNSSYQDQIVAKNVFGILYLDYKDKYIFDGMYRYDGSSLFGENERWQPYYRVSGAWRISEDFPINGIQEMKIRAAYGTSGQRPGFSSQYEVMSVANGVSSKNTLGNKDLKPSRSIETEVGLNIDFLNRLSFELIYAKGETEDQFLEAPQPINQGGWPQRWGNYGALETNTIEASLRANIINKANFGWNVGVVFDRTRSKITQLDIPPYQYGPEGQEADKLFYIREGETFGVMYGASFITSMDQLAQQIEFMDGTVEDYMVNSDGYIIQKGTEGTIDEEAVKLLDEEGNNAFVAIGDGNPDFKMGITSNFRYKNIGFYMLWDWKQGGDVYNKTAQWLTRDDRNAMMDQAGKAEGSKKTIDYYKVFYDTNDFNDFWVEDGTYLKLRELSLSYSLGKSALSGFANGFVKGLKLSFIGRNLLTFTNYSGYDPEVATTNGTQAFAYDFMGYPNYRTFSGSLEIKF